MMADGQVTQGDEIIKNNVKKLRTLSDGKVVCGFAGTTVDCLTLVEILEKNLETYQGQLLRSCVEMTKKWRTTREYGNLNASLIVADATDLLVVTGNGDVLQPQGNIASVGSGSQYAKAAARALLENNNSGLPVEVIAEKAMKIAADMCVYTNDSFIMEKIDFPENQ
jgi:ATP-dependent HslUV protease subunit HslV